jgi:hypothetical protein
MEPDTNPSDNTEHLGLEPEANQLMAQPSERTDLADDEKLTQFFGRALADGQQETVEPAVEQAQAEEDLSDGSEFEPEPQNEETHGEEQSQDERKAPKGVDKRISKLTAQRREAEERAKQLESELETLKREKAAPRNEANPYNAFNSEEKIQAEYERQKEIRLFCERYPDGYYEDGKEPISKEQIAKAKVAALKAVDDYLPQQLDYVNKSKAFKAAARQEFPWLDNDTDKRAIMAKRFVDAVPELKRFPDYEIYAAHLANGMISYQQQKSAAKQGIAAQRVPVQPTSNAMPSSSAPKANANVAKQAAERYRRTSSLDDLSEVFRNKFI